MLHLCFTGEQFCFTMATNRLTVNYYLHPTKLQDGTQRVRGRIIYNRQKAEFSTEYSCHAKEWLSKEGEFKKSSYLNEELIKQKGEIFKKKSQLEFEKQGITAKKLRDAALGRNNNRSNLIEFVNEFINTNTSSQKLSPQRIRHYKVTLNYLKSFLKEQNLSDIELKYLDYKFIEDWDNFLNCQKTKQFGTKMSQSTLNSHHTRLKTILNSAFKKGLIPVLPYANFRLRKTVNLPKYLSKEELIKIESHDLGDNKSLHVIRDLFIFSCYTGLRFSDAQRLSENDVQQGTDGSFYIELKQQKTQTEVYIPLLPNAQSIITKYHNSDHRMVLGKLLPQISNVKVNTYLKVIQDLVGVKTKLTHNVARHTFATTILLDAGIPLEVTSKLMGHTNLATTQIYGKITKGNIDKHLNTLKK